MFLVLRSGFDFRIRRVRCKRSVLLVSPFSTPLARHLAAIRVALGASLNLRELIQFFAQSCRNTVSGVSHDPPHNRGKHHHDSIQFVNLIGVQIVSWRRWHWHPPWPPRHLFQLVSPCWVLRAIRPVASNRARSLPGGESAACFGPSGKKKRF